MTPEIAVLLQRAAARRMMIEGLLDSIPATFWSLRAPDDAWSARDHLCHLATIDDIVLPLVQEAVEGIAPLLLAGPQPGDLDRRRSEAMASVASASTAELRSRMWRSREAVAGAIGHLPQFALDHAVFAVGIVGPQEDSAEWPLRTYLSSWAEHDGVHEAAIRRALTAPPDLSAIALARRRT